MNVHRKTEGTVEFEERGDGGDCGLASEFDLNFLIWVAGCGIEIRCLS